ncbi:unnamed protein product, partial [Effrenium voratum]
VAACAWMRGPPPWACPLSGTPLCEPWVPMGRRGLLRSGPRAVCLTFCDKIHAKVQQQQRQDLRVVLPQFDRQRTWAWCPSTAAWWTRLRPKAGRGTRLSRTQSRSWADRRVREGIGKARSGDQKAALERYEAALELCPQHKEGLVGRGAALANLGRAREALRDFDAAPEAAVSEFAGVQGIKAPSEGTGTRAVGNIVSA